VDGLGGAGKEIKVVAGKAREIFLTMRQLKPVSFNLHVDTSSKLAVGSQQGGRVRKEKQ
jgi:hypothetical protein